MTRIVSVMRKKAQTGVEKMLREVRLAPTRPDTMIGRVVIVCLTQDESPSLLEDRAIILCCSVLMLGINDSLMLILFCHFE